MQKYQFKNKDLKNALGVLYGNDYVADQVERQMKDSTTSYIEFESDDGSTTIAKEEVEVLDKAIYREIENVLDNKRQIHCV